MKAGCPHTRSSAFWYQLAMTTWSKFTRGMEYARGFLKGHPWVRIGAHVRLTGPGNYRLHPRSSIRGGARLWVGPGATLTLERGSAIGARSIVNVESGLRLGEGTQVSWDVQILDTDFHKITGANGQVRPYTSPITIGRHVLVGTGAMILKGTTIGDDAVIAAGSVVTRSVAPHRVVAGNPAREVGTAETWA